MGSLHDCDFLFGNAVERIHERVYFGFESGDVGGGGGAFGGEDGAKIGFCLASGTAGMGRRSRLAGG
jgi:hypothetical protein